MATESIQGLRYPIASDPNDPPTDFKNLADDVVTRTVMRFASTGARDAAITSPVNGMMCFITADNSLYVRASGAWKQMWLDTGWVSITPNSGYTAGENLAVRRTGDRVQMRGSIKKNSGNFAINDGAMDVVFTLPSALFIPGFQVRKNLNVIQSSAGAGTMLINTNGNCVVTATGTSVDTYRCHIDFLVN